MKNIKSVLILLAYVFTLSAEGEAQMVGSFITISPLHAHYIGSTAQAATSVNGHLFLPSDYSTNSEPCPLILDFPGTGDGGNTMIPRAIAGGLDITRVKHPITGHIYHMASCSIYTASGDAPEPSILRQTILWLLSHYNFDPYRIYLSGYSQGAGTVILYMGIVDSISQYIAAAYACSGSFSWYPPGTASGTATLKGTGPLVRDYHIMWWGTNGVNDGVVNYSNVISENDSLAVYTPASQHHYSLIPGTFPTGGGHAGWEYMVSDTLPIEPTYWAYNDGTTNARGGKPFYGSFFEWCLLFTNSLTPGGNAGNLTVLNNVPSPTIKYLPVIHSSVNFEWLRDETYGVSFHAYNSSEDKQYDVQESDDGIHWKTVSRIPADGDRDYQETFDL